MDSTGTFTKGQRERMGAHDARVISVIDDDESLRRSLADRKSVV